MISLSQGVRPLLDLLQFRCGVSLEVVDASLRVAPLEPAADFAVSVHDSSVRERCLEVIRSGEQRVDRTLPQPHAFYPLRRDRQIVGVLIVSVRPQTAASPSTGEPPQFELAGQLAKAAIEHDLALTTQIGEAADRTRRLEGILRFLTQLTARDGEPALMDAVIQAATVWFDVDCRIYRREGESFVVYAALPGVDRSELQARLDVARVRQLAVRRRISPDDLDLLTWRMRRGELLCLPIGSGFEWVMLLAGVVNPEVETTFNAVAQALAGALQEAATRRLESWRRRLDFYAGDLSTAPERVSLHMLQELAAAAGLLGARLSLHRLGTVRVVAAFNMTSDVTPARVVPVSGDAEVRLEVIRSEEPLNQEALSVIDAWIAAVRPWLQGAAPLLISQSAPHETEETTFEQRIQDEIERAKRFDLNLGLVLIGIEHLPGLRQPLQFVIDAVRTELRASDLIGRVSGGRVAILLVHAGAESAELVAGRLRRRLSAIAQEAPLGALRLGQTMFSPERQTTRELILDAAHRLEELHTTGRNG